MSFPPANEMFQFAGFASWTYGFSPRSVRRLGLPHSEIRESTSARLSSRLFAACHVLHRLSVPRHPPDALMTLDPSPSSFSPHAGTNPVVKRQTPFLKTLLPSMPMVLPAGRLSRAAQPTKPTALEGTLGSHISTMSNNQGSGIRDQKDTYPSPDPRLVP